jgi:hypothetical protein
VTDFDVTSYPLEISTRFSPSLGTKIDVTSDGTPRSRTLTSVRPIKINCVFNPLSAAASEEFEDYLYANAAVELDITHNGKIYRGFIDGDSVDKQLAGPFHLWTFSFMGRAV